MRATFISTMSLMNSPRASASKLQVELAKANKEVVTGRHADVGATLGHRTGEGISLRQDHAALEAIASSNAVTQLRLGVTRTSLDSIRQNAENFLSTIVGVPPQTIGARALRQSAAANLSGLLFELNQFTNGQFIFSGTDTNTKPVHEYVDGSAAKESVDTAFMDFFEFDQSSPNVAGIEPSQMEVFLDTAFAPLFDDDKWKANWSSAQDENLESRISPTEKVQTSTNANEAAIRKLAMAYTMASDLGIERMSERTRSVVIARLADLVGSGTEGLVQIQADLGTSERKITEANERIDLRKMFLQEAVGKLESVDPAEAKTRIDGLMTQIQMSYSLTSQLRQLNLLNYL